MRSSNGKPGLGVEVSKGEAFHDRAFTKVVPERDWILLARAAADDQEFGHLRPA